MWENFFSGLWENYYVGKIFFRIVGGVLCGKTIFQDCGGSIMWENCFLFFFRIVGGKEVNPKHKLPYQVLVSVSLSNQKCIT